MLVDTLPLGELIDKFAKLRSVALLYELFPEVDPSVLSSLSDSASNLAAASTTPSQSPLSTSLSNSAARALSRDVPERADESPEDDPVLNAEETDPSVDLESLARTAAVAPTEAQSPSSICFSKSSLDTI
jgi:hypothetical protein